MKYAVIILTTMIISGCSLVPEYAAMKNVAKAGIETAIEDRKSYNDTKANTLREVLGDISIGAYYRNFGQEERCAIALLLRHECIYTEEEPVDANN